MATTCKESELARAVLDAQAYEAECERGPIDCERLEQARQATRRARDNFTAFRNWGVAPKAVGR